MKYRLTFFGWYLLIVILVISICLLLSGCRTQYVTVPEYHTEYIAKTDSFFRIDTIINNTNTVIREANDGDSLLLAEYGIRLKDNERLLLLLRQELQKATSKQQEAHTDTIIKTDSIRVPYPVEKSLSRWQQIKLDIGEYVLVLLALLAALVLIKRKHLFS